MSVSLSTGQRMQGVRGRQGWHWCLGYKDAKYECEPDATIAKMSESSMVKYGAGLGCYVSSDDLERPRATIADFLHSFLSP